MSNKHSDKQIIEMIANDLNLLSKGYNVGNLPEIRKKLKNLIRPRKKIFGLQTINDEYAFHNGGRKEAHFILRCDHISDV